MRNHLMSVFCTLMLFDGVWRLAEWILWHEGYIKAVRAVLIVE